MEEKENLFGEYVVDKTIKGRVTNPKTWVNLLILIIIITMAVILIQSVMGSWSREEIKKSIKIIDFNSMWVVKDVAFSGENSKKQVSIIPKITFKIKNIGKRELEFVRFLGNFVYAEKRTSSIGDGYSDILKNNTLKPGEVSDLISIKSAYGYKTSTSSNETYSDMFFNKKGWKQFNVRISARVKGTVKEIGEYPVENRIENEIRDNVDSISNEIEVETVFKDLKIKNYQSEWRHVKEAKGNLFIPTIKFQLKNSAIKIFEDLLVLVSFDFDDKQGVISQWKGKKTIKINILSGKSLSEELYFEAENGVKASSVEKLFLNKTEWKDVKVKIYIGTKQIKPSLLTTLEMTQTVKGYRVREKVIH